MLVLSLGLRTVLAHKLRFAMTTFAVVLGVGFVVGAFVVTDTLSAAVTGLFEGISSRTDVTVRAATDLGSGATGPASRGRIPAGLLPEVAAVDGVETAGVSLAGYAQLLDEQGAPMTTTGAPFLGVNWAEDERLNPATIVSGRAPRQAGEVAIDEASAGQYDLAVGDRTTMLAVDGRHDVEVVGVFAFGESSSLLGARITAMENAWAAEVLGSGAQVDTIDVRAKAGIDADELAARIRPALPAGVEAVTSRQVVDEGVDQVAGILTVFQRALLAFAGIALFVSAFTINNTFSIVLGQRVRELSLLRALGATGRQVLASVLFEATVIGAVACAAGIICGLAIARVLEAILAAGGLDLPDEPLVLDARTLVAAVAVGLPVTVVAALAPARRAARLAPIEGLRAGAREGASADRSRLVTGALLTVAGLALVGTGLFVLDDGTAVYSCLAVGAAALFLGVTRLGPLIAVPVAAGLGWPAARAGGPSCRLARANAVNHPQRTARAASALMVGLALVTAAFVVGESMKRSLADAVEGAVTADFVVTGAGYTGFSPEVAEQVRAVPGIAAATGVRFDRFRFAGQESDISAADRDAIGEVIDLDLVAGDPADLGSGSILVHVDPASDHDLDVGDTVEVEYATGGPQQVRVAGIYRDATFAGNYVMDLATFFVRYPANNLDRFVFAAAAEGADLAVTEARLNEVLAPLPQLELETRDEFSRTQRDELNQMLVAVNGLLGLALVIALLGIANTLALSVVERTREIGLERAVGMTRRQVRATVLAEAAIVAGFGALAGVAVGLVLGIAAVAAMPPSIITRLGVPAATLVTVVVVAVVLGVVAALVPARRAARLDVLRAIAVE